jgi:hypothetical protein
VKEPNTFFQEISIRWRVIITVWIFNALTVAIELYRLIAIVETNKRHHRRVRERRMMVKATDTVCFGILNARSIIKDLPPEENDHNSEGENG